MSGCGIRVKSILTYPLFNICKEYESKIDYKLYRIIKFIAQ